MNDQRILRYFLGGNTYRGFYSLYDSFIPPDDNSFLWILKGGPGCGKSSFMKMIGGAAEDAGLSVEYAVCSGDPASLDGVYIPELKTAYTDGTAPHVSDTHMVAVDSAYLNLGEFYDYEAIGEYRDELKELYRRCGACYKKAYSLIAAAGQLQSGWQNGFALPSENDAALKRAVGIASREFGKRRREKGKITYRFLSALTCRGTLSFPETMAALCSRVYVFDNKLYMSPPVLQRIADAALDTGLDVTVCPDPLTPETVQAVIIPSLRLGFSSAGSESSGIPVIRRIRLDTLAESGRLKKVRAEIRRCEKLKESLLGEAFSSLNEAKTIHDRIESIFNPHVDFDCVGELARKHIAALGL